jgi:3-phenylpropionate/cinnamic acid dioxygenase small subunit
MNDRLEILDLIYRYAELIDAGDFDGVGELLSKARFGGPRTPTVSGAQNIAGIFAIPTKRFPDTGTPKTRHLVLNPIVEVDGDTATARSTFCVLQATDVVAFGPIVAGRYYDRFARDAAGGWHFTERIADVEMTGDTSDHLLIAADQFDR